MTDAVGQLRRAVRELLDLRHLPGAHPRGEFHRQLREDRRIVGHTNLPKKNRPTESQRTPRKTKTNLLEISFSVAYVTLWFNSCFHRPTTPAVIRAPEYTACRRRLRSRRAAGRFRGCSVARSAARGSRRARHRRVVRARCAGARP